MSGARDFKSTRPPTCCREASTSVQTSPAQRLSAHLPPRRRPPPILWCPNPHPSSLLLLPPASCQLCASDGTRTDSRDRLRSLLERPSIAAFSRCRLSFARRPSYCPRQLPRGRIHSSPHSPLTFPDTHCRRTEKLWRNLSLSSPRSRRGHFHLPSQARRPQHHNNPALRCLPTSEYEPTALHHSPDRPTPPRPML